MIERTLVLIKPDAVAAKVVGQILARYEAAGLAIEAMEIRRMTHDVSAQHYAEHVERDFYESLRDFMCSGPLVAAVLSGEDAIARVRELNGATNPANADPGTIRADFAESVRRNAVHASDSAESARREIAIWFN